MATAKRYAGFVAVLALLSACTLKKQETPPLTGPSTLGTSVQMTASPDTLTQDGASQSQVTVQVFDSNGQPKRNVSMRAEIMVDGTLVDFGSLSARNVVTDANGRANLIYTAPASNSSVDGFTTVKIVVTPAEGDFANATGRFVDIRLVPVGMVIPPDGMTPDFVMLPTSATDHQDVLFDASKSTSYPTNPIANFMWDFGDGDTGSGRTTTHAFDLPGTFLVTLTIEDAFGRRASKTQPITITQGGSGMTAQIIVSPTPPLLVGQQAFFNGSTSRPAPGNRIVSYRWDFGDGTTGSGATFTHAFATAGSYVVILTITDDAGRTQTATTSVNVTDGAPTAAFTFSPSAPTVTPPATTVSVTFDASSSTAVSGRTITSYSWSFGDGTSGSGSTVSHSFGTGTFNVTLTVTDSAGKTNTTTRSVTVS
jgi:PKD repeat protein